MFLVPGVFGHWQKYLLDRHKICINCDVHCYDVPNTSVIVKNSCCVELVFSKLLGGEFVTTTVEMPPGWPVGFCIAVGLNLVEVPHGGSGKFPKVHVLCAYATTCCM